MKAQAKKTSRWKDPKFRRKYMRNYIREWRRKNPDAAANHSYMDLLDKNLKYANDPEYRKKILEKAKQRWRDPEFRKRRAAYMREYRRRRRETGM